MDWLTLFTVLVVVASTQTAPEVSKKKIRIHLPQKVKHIHHHKKIYITNHPASSQYAPAFMPSAEGVVAVPTNVAVPTLAKVINPYNSVEMYGQPPTRLPSITSAASKLLPLYRARGYYGPTPSDWDDEDELQDSSDSSYIPITFAASSAPVSAPVKRPKRVNYVKHDEPAKKKILRKGKSKRVLLQGKPQVEEEHPVSTFHEQFYSDLDGTGTIRKIKKPQRIEKIIDGDTEHIHTYSEEHIHKIVFDDGSKVTRVKGVDPVGNVAVYAPSHRLVPMKNGPPLIALPSSTLRGFSAVSPMGTPPHLEYAAYNPREVTHDHIFHDHGEIPSDVDITQSYLSYPPKVTYNQGVRFGANKSYKNKNSHKYLKPKKVLQQNKFNYYENLYNPYHGLQNIQRPVIPNVIAPLTDAGLEDVQSYRPIPSFKLKEKAPHVKTRNVVPALYFNNAKPETDDRLKKNKISSPYVVSSTIVHNYKPKDYPEHGAGHKELTKFNKNHYNYPHTYEIDSYAASSSIINAGLPSSNYRIKNGKEKSISTQNISFGGLDHQTTVDHIRDSSISETSINEDSGEDNFNANNDYEQPGLEAVTSTVFTIKESSPVHPYYSIMAVKALQGEQLPLAEASNDNYQYAKAPTSMPITSPKATISTPPSEYFNIQEPVVTQATDHGINVKQSSKELNSLETSAHKKPKRRYKLIAIHSIPAHSQNEAHKNTDSTSSPTNLKYGDKI